MSKLLSSAEDFADVEKGIFRLVQEATLRLMCAFLGELDEQLMRERDVNRLKMVHSKSRQIWTPFGALQFKRRYYKDRETGEGRFLLDEALGLAAGRRVSPWLAGQATALAVEMPYHRAARVLRETTLGAIDLSAMEIWRQVQTAGSGIRRRAEEQRRALFEDGELPGGTRKSERVNIEMDEVWVAGRRQAGRRGHIPIKIGVAYEGKAEVGPGRRELVERRVMAGVAGAEAFTEQAFAQMFGHWDYGSVKECHLGGDGAQWIRGGCEYFPGAMYHLDPYHLHKALLEGLRHDEPAYEAVRTALAAHDWASVETTLIGAQKRATGAQRKRVKDLERYLRNNWEGIGQTDAAERLGAIEGQVFHHAARRMKRHGARWGADGADHLARTLAAQANGELGAATKRAWRMQPEMISRVLDKAAQIQTGTDPADWLRAGMPALLGPKAGSLLVKQVLREIARGSALTA
jgi:hypothetical protein